MAGLIMLHTPGSEGKGRTVAITSCGAQQTDMNASDDKLISAALTSIG